MRLEPALLALPMDLGLLTPTYNAPFIFSTGLLHLYVLLPADFQDLNSSYDALFFLFIYFCEIGESRLSCVQ